MNGAKLKTLKAFPRTSLDTGMGTARLGLVSGSVEPRPYDSNHTHFGLLKRLSIQARALVEFNLKSGLTLTFASGVPSDS